MAFDPSTATLADKPKTSFDPTTATPVDAAPPAMTPNPIDWGKFYTGKNAADAPLNPVQVQALEKLGANSPDNPAEAQNRAINQAYVGSRIGNLNGETVAGNWDAVKAAYAKTELGYTGAALSDSSLRAIISEHMQSGTAEAFDNAKKLQWEPPQTGFDRMVSWMEKYGPQVAKKNAVEAITPGFQPLVKLPTAPQGEDRRILGFYNPAVMNGVYNAVKPLVEGIESPVGILTIGIGSELHVLKETYPVAGKALASMTGIFAGLMAKQTIDAIPEAKKTLNDPQATLQDRVTAVATPVVDGIATLLGAVGAATEVMPKAKAADVLDQFSGQPPAKVAEILREAANDVHPANAPVVIEAAQKMEEIADHRYESPVTNDFALSSEAASQRASDVAKHPAGEAPATEADPATPQSVNLDQSPGRVARMKAAEEANAEIKRLRESRDADIQVEESEDPPDGEDAGEAAAPPPVESPAPVPVEPKIGESLIGIKNETIDAELARMGKEPATHGEQVTFKGEMDKAAKTLKDNPDAGRHLVAELEAKPRPVTGTEDAILLHEQNRLRLARDAAENELVSATKSGDVEAQDRAKIKVAQARDDFSKAADVVTQVGTKNAQGLALRRMMIKEDYSLASMERRRIIANDGKPLTETQAKEVSDLKAKLDQTQKAFDDYRAQQEAKSVIRPDRQPRKSPPPSKVITYLSEQATAARARIAARAGQLNSGIDPTQLADLAIIGAEHLAKGAAKFADWSAVMIKEFGEAVKPHLDAIFEKSTSAVESAKLQNLLERKKAALVKSIEKLKGKVETGDLTPEAQKANRPQIEEIEKLEQQRTDLRDELAAMRAHADKMEELKQSIADKEQKLKEHDLSAKGQPANRPANADIEKLKQDRDTLNKQLEKARTEAAKPTEKERIKSQVDAIHEQIAKKREMLRTGNITPESKAANRPMAAELEKAKQELEAVTAEIEQARRGPPKTAEESRAESLERQIAEIERQLREGEVFANGKKAQPTSPEIKAKETQLERLKEQREYERERLQPKADPKSPEEIALAAYKTRTAARIAELEEKLSTGDLSNPGRKPLPLDKEALRLKANLERVKNLVRLAEMRDELKNRSIQKKVQDAFVSWVRIGALSWPTVLAKLTGAAAIRAVSTPVEQAIGFGVSKLLPELASMAPREGVPSLGTAMRAEARALTEGITTGMKGAWDMLRNKETEESVLLDKVHLPPTLTEYLGKLHGALKYPTKIAEYARSLQLRTEFYMKAGVDAKDPVIQMRMMHEAWMDANRSIFMQDNAVVDAYKQGLAALERKNKNGDTSTAMSWLATGIRTELPIVKVPTNVIAEASTILTGWLTGPAKAAFAYAKGIENLKPTEADAIMRLIKKGSIGLALTALGFYNASEFGGFYEKGEKRKKGDLKPMEVKIADLTVPSQLVHSPYFDALQFGASMRKIADSKYKQSDHDPQGIGSGLLAASLGLIGETPFLRETSTIEKYLDSRQAINAASSKGASILVPGVIQWIAAQMDKKEPFNLTEDSVKRSPKGLKENLEKAIPILRENITTKK